MPPKRFLADIGNSRLKFARVDSHGEMALQTSVVTELPETWSQAIETLGGFESGCVWGISSVRPEAAQRLATLLDEAGVLSVRWFRSVADIPIRHALENPESAGADRALAILGFLAQTGIQTGGVVVMCGTALTVEQVSPDGCWQGGAIAPGWRPLAQALHVQAAQLPFIEQAGVGSGRGPGTNTQSAIQVGLQGMMVGGCRELVQTMRHGLPSSARTVWTGGDASWLARAVDGEFARIETDLVFRGLLEALGWSRVHGPRP